MFNFLNWRTIVMMGSAALLALVCVLESTRSQFPLWAISLGLQAANTIFHEVGGHALFAWLTGHPAIPYLEILGSNATGGHTLWMPKSWIVQIGAWGLLGYGCYWARENFPFLFFPMLGFTIAIVLLSIAREDYQHIVISFMGPGSAILAGGFLLFRAWIDSARLGQLERWLSALFGFSQIFYNIHYFYLVAYDPIFREFYTGVTMPNSDEHEDFLQIVDIIPSWTLTGICQFTVGLAIVTMIGSFFAAMWLQYDFIVDDKSRRIND